MRAFVSHNHKDKPAVRSFATKLRLGGMDIWLDEWELSPGDSIPGKVGVALDTVDTVLVCWSEHASTSEWVKSELETAIIRRLEDGLRIIPVCLDDTPLPALLRPLYWVSVTEDDDQTAVNKILGVDTTGFLQGVQRLLDEATIVAVSFHGAGVYVICPNCGAPPAKLEQWGATDHDRGDQYAGVRCTECRWEEGGEV